MIRALGVASQQLADYLIGQGEELDGALVHV